MSTPSISWPGRPPWPCHWHGSCARGPSAFKRRPSRKPGLPVHRSHEQGSDGAAVESTRVGCAAVELEGPPLVLLQGVPGLAGFIPPHFSVDLRRLDGEITRAPVDLSICAARLTPLSAVVWRQDA